MNKYALKLLLLLSFVPLTLWAGSTNKTIIFTEGNRIQPQWYSTHVDGNPRIHLYFFWSKRCPHCRRALPLVTKLRESYPWLELHAFELSENRRNVRLYFAMTEMIGQRSGSVPGFLFCEQKIIGYDSEKTTGLELRQKLEICYQQRVQASQIEPPPVKTDDK